MTSRPIEPDRRKDYDLGAARAIIENLLATPTSETWRGLAQEWVTQQTQERAMVRDQPA